MVYTIALSSSFCLISMHLSIQLVFRFFGIMATAAISTPIAIALVFVVMILFLLFRWFVLKTSREIKRLEALGEIVVCLIVLLHCWNLFH